MVEALALAGALAATCLGLAWLALAMAVHWRQVHGQAGPTPSGRWQMRGLGGLGLAVSLGLCLAVDHASMAVLVWIMLLAAGALLVAATLAWRPGLLVLLWPTQR